MNKTKITIGTRKSQLALIQSHYVRDRLTERWPGLTVDINHIVTKGDKILDVPLAKIGDKGLFTKELENALLEGSADIAVHSFKDLPTKLPEGLCVGAVLLREPNEDALIAPAGTTIASLPAGARVGTSSLRRRAQLLHARPDLDICELRGNVNTRVDKLLAGQFDAIVLARAGVKRMKLEEHVSEIISMDTILPAVGQGALAIEARSGDTDVLQLLEFLNDAETRMSTTAERAFLEALEGGCQIPIGAAATVDGDTLTLRGLVASIDGKRVFKGEEKGAAADPVAIGKELARRLVEQGAGETLAEIRAMYPIA